jgi:hypothetical protein
MTRYTWRSYYLPTTNASAAKDATSKGGATNDDATNSAADLCHSYKVDVEWLGLWN